MALLTLYNQALAGEDDPEYRELILEQYNRNIILHPLVGIAAMVTVRDNAIASRPRRRQIRHLLAAQLYADRLEEEFALLLQTIVDDPNPAAIMNDLTTFRDELTEVSLLLSRLPETLFMRREIHHLQQHFTLEDMLRDATWLDQARRRGRLGSADSVSTPTTRMIFRRRSLEQQLLAYADRIPYVRSAIRDNRSVNDDIGEQIRELELQNRYAASIVHMQQTIPYDEPAYSDVQRQYIAGQIAEMMARDDVTLMEQIRSVQPYRVMLAFDGIMRYRRHELPQQYTILRPIAGGVTPEERQQLITQIYHDTAPHLDPIMTPQQRTDYVREILFPVAYQLRLQHGG
jgi:hypothetical protein